MAKNYFVLQPTDDMSWICREIINWFKHRQYEVESKTLNHRYFIQAKKTSTLRTLLGANLAFKVYLHESIEATSDREIVIETSTGKWISNIAGASFATVMMLWIPVINGIPFMTGIANAGWALLLENELLNYLENILNLTRVSPTHSSGYAGVKSRSENATAPVQSQSSTAREQAEARVREERIRLEQALAEAVIDRFTFNQKNDRLEEKVDRYEAEIIIEEKMKKLEQAFSEGILETAEYEAKVKEVHDLVDQEVVEKRVQSRREEKRQKLKEALDNGILTAAEYDKKLRELD